MIFVIALIKMRPCNKVSLVKQYVQVYSTYSGGSGGSGRLSRRKYTVRILTLCASLSSIMAAVGNQTNKHFSVAQKTAAVQMRKANVPLKTIRNQLKLSKSTLQRILAHAKHNPHEPVKPRKAGTGKAGKVPQGCLRQMKQMLRKNPCLTAKQLKERIPGFANVTVRWIQCLCKDKLKMPSRKMAKKPLLNQRMMDQRLEFAREYGGWGVEEWKSVMFSDESHFELHLGPQPGRCRRPLGSDRFASQFTQKTVKHPQKVMVWGCFSWKSRGGLEFLRQGEMMNSQRYLRVLEDKLELFMRQHGTSHFLQDGAPCHTAKVVKSWFAERPHIILIKWPGNSPDLNPIENVWSWMKHQLKSTNCRTMEEWILEIKRLWVLRMEDSDYLKKLVESMPRRLAEVIERGGACTKY